MRREKKPRSLKSQTKRSHRFPVGLKKTGYGEGLMSGERLASNEILSGVVVRKGTG